MDELGIDVSVIYPSLGLVFPHLPDTDHRRRCCRALNRYHRDVFGRYRDRLVPVAVVPMHTPDEAIAELEHAVGELGLRAVLVAGLVHRPLPASASDPAAGNRASWIDTFGLDSAFDYDPFWQRCVDLHVSVAAHAFGMGWGSRQSTSSYDYNHIGNFAAAGEALCKSLFLGGVTRRFPTLRFAFLEGGVAWACSLLADLVGHWDKRNADTVRHYDPRRADIPRFLRYFDEHGRADFGACEVETRQDRPRDWSLLERWAPDQLERVLGIDGADPEMLDEFAACGIKSVDDIRELFVPRFFFGCEGDDPTVGAAFDPDRNALGARLSAMFGSDIGHWDVPAMERTLVDAYESVERGRLTRSDFRDLVFVNPVRFYTDSDPAFFEETCIAAEVRRFLAGSPPGGGSSGRERE
jgi:hypothetical protein